MADDTHSRFASVLKDDIPVRYNFKLAVGHTTKQMKHGRSCDIEIWCPSVENVGLGLRLSATFSTSCLSYFNVTLTTVHHLYIVTRLYLRNLPRPRLLVVHRRRAAWLATGTRWRLHSGWRHQPTNHQAQRPRQQPLKHFTTNLCRDLNHDWITCGGLI